MADTAPAGPAAADTAPADAAPAGPAPKGGEDAAAADPARAAADALAALAGVVAALPGGAERPSQVAMCTAVAQAIGERRHLLVQAGTGTGKGLAYLVPAVLAGTRTVVVTATRSLQEQLVGKDLPLLAEHLGRPFTHALLKGRSNYLCLARRAELDDERSGALELDGRGDLEGLDAVDEWLAGTETGDRSDLSVAVSDRLWERLSVDSRECPGRAKCGFGDGCFAEAARDRAARADLVVVNAALYTRDLEAAGAVLPEHDVVVIDEAHTLEDVAAGAFGEELGPGRLRHLAGAVARLLVAEGGRDPVGRLHEWADRIEALFATLPEDAPVELPDDVRDGLTALGDELADLSRTVAGIDPGDGAAAVTKLRVAKLVDSARVDVASLLAAKQGVDALWVEHRRSGPVLHATAVDVGARLHEALFARRTAILTSATLATGGDFSTLAWRLGLRPDRVPDPAAAESPVSDPAAADPAAADPAAADPAAFDAAAAESLASDPAAADPAAPGAGWSQPGRDAEAGATNGSRRPADPAAYTGLDVGSPFDYRRQAILYVAAHLPDPRSDEYEEAMLDEAEALVRAAGGRTLGLCTSLRAAEALRARLRAALDVRVLAPDDLPRPRIMEEFARDETSCLVGSLSLWQGIDVPGPAVNLVIVDKIPFARPTDPYAVARREHAAAQGHDPFLTFDVPRAAMLLAQGAGRLVRHARDRGVVAVLDPRLLSKRYGATLLASLPPMYRMTDGERVRAALARLHDARVGAP
jgi:ATP-dependent DNA helicase DinG